MLIVCISLSLAILRVQGVKSEPFQAFAHLWVGGLIATWITIKFSTIDPFSIGYNSDIRQLTGFSALILSIIELACFLFLK